MLGWRKLAPLLDRGDVPGDIVPGTLREASKPFARVAEGGDPIGPKFVVAEGAEGRGAEVGRGTGDGG
jgi:hypothetical protein